MYCSCRRRWVGVAAITPCAVSTHTQRETEKRTERHMQRETHKETHSERHTQRDTKRETHAERHVQRDTYRETRTERHIQRDKYKDRDKRQRQRHTSSEFSAAGVSGGVLSVVNTAIQRASSSRRAWLSFSVSSFSDSRKSRIICTSISRQSWLFVRNHRISGWATCVCEHCV